MSYAEPNSERELRDAVARARADGSGSLTVPFFGGNSQPFDELVRSGVASGYILLVEISLTEQVQL